MASGPITSWKIDGKTVSDFIFLGSKITADGDCSQPGSSVNGIFQAGVLEWDASGAGYLDSSKLNRAKWRKELRVIVH